MALVDSFHEHCPPVNPEVSIPEYRVFKCPSLRKYCFYTSRQTHNEAPKIVVFHDTLLAELGAGCFMRKAGRKSIQDGLVLRALTPLRVP